MSPPSQDALRHLADTLRRQIGELRAQLESVLQALDETTDGTSPMRDASTLEMGAMQRRQDEAAQAAERRQVPG